MLPQEFGPAAPRHAALRLAHWARSEAARPAKVLVTREVEQEHVDLMVRHTWTGCRADLRHRLVARPSEFAKTSQVCNPNRKIDILALVQKFDPEAPVRLKARDLARQRPSNAAEQRNALHLSEQYELCGHGVSSGTESLLTQELEAILLGDLMC
jgi:hypothetical protein